MKGGPENLSSPPVGPPAPAELPHAFAVERHRVDPHGAVDGLSSRGVFERRRQSPAHEDAQGHRGSSAPQPRAVGRTPSAPTKTNSSVAPSTSAMAMSKAMPIQAAPQRTVSVGAARKDVPGVPRGRCVAAAFAAPTPAPRAATARRAPQLGARGPSMDTCCPSASRRRGRLAHKASRRGRPAASSDVPRSSVPRRVAFVHDTIYGAVLQCECKGQTPTTAIATVAFVAGSGGVPATSSPLTGLAAFAW